MVAPASPTMTGTRGTHHEMTLKSDLPGSLRWKNVPGLRGAEGTRHNGREQEPGSTVGGNPRSFDGDVSGRQSS